MTRDLVIALTLTSAKQCAPRRLAPVSSPSSTANTRARNSGNASANSFARVGRLRGAHASSRAGERVPRSRTFLSLGRAHYVHDSQKNIVSVERRNQVAAATATQSFHTHTSIAPYPILLSRASPKHRNPCSLESPQIPWNRSQTSARRRLLIV